MRLRLTPQNIEDAYNYLKGTAPFNKWKLPDADDLEFQVTGDNKLYGHFETSTAKARQWPVIGVSSVRTKTSLALIETVAHEMAHLKQFADKGHRGPSHGPSFKSLAKTICQHHGFDLRTF